jgi:hypothetical protein
MTRIAFVKIEAVRTGGFWLKFNRRGHFTARSLKTERQATATGEKIQDAGFGAATQTDQLILDSAPVHAFVAFPRSGKR